jgi:excisionase family DNA binding protein
MSLDVVVTLTDAQLDEIARRAAALVPAPAVSPWLTSEQAADYLACSRDRVHDLCQLGKLHPRRDGRRLLFRASDLDDYLEASA